MEAFMPESSAVTFLVHFIAMSAFVAGATVNLHAQETAEVPREVRLDIDRDGKLDLARIVETPDDGSGDLQVYLGIGDGAPDPDVEPDFVKKDVLAGTMRAFERRGKDALALTICTGCTSMVWIDETLVIVHRGRRLMVGGFDQGWEVSHRRADGNVDVNMGSCSINFLTGKARVSKGLEPDHPVKQRFQPVTLADWSEDTIPAICHGR
jgi:hypothetical protein